MTLLAPSPIGVETLDAADADPAVVRSTLRDLAVVNTLAGGRRAVALAFREVLRRHPDRAAVSVLDVGAGGGDILTHLVAVGARLGVRVRPLALDRLPAAARLCHDVALPSVVADAGNLPVAPCSVDVVVASQLLHHFDRASAAALLRTLAGVARVGVIVADLRRSHVARLGIRVLAAVMRFHPVTGQDGDVSVRRGFTVRELRALCARGGLDARVGQRAGFRLVAVSDTSRAYR